MFPSVTVCVLDSFVLTSCLALLTVMLYMHLFCFLSCLRPCPTTGVLPDCAQAFHVTMLHTDPCPFSMILIIDYPSILLSACALTPDLDIKDNYIYYILDEMR